MRVPRPRRGATSTDTDTVTGETATGSPISALSRRMLLTRGSLGLVAAGVVSAMPAMPAVVNSVEAEAPEAQATVAEGESLAGPLIAQVKDLQTGEVSLYSGENEISVFDRALAARLFNAAK